MGREHSRNVLKRKSDAQHDPKSFGPLQCCCDSGKVHIQRVDTRALASRTKSRESSGAWPLHDGAAAHEGVR